MSPAPTAAAILTPTTVTPEPTTAALIPGETVYFYADAAHVGGMTRLDDTEPFKAIVAYSHSDRLVNLLVIDHVGSIFPLESVVLYQGDDKDDKLVPCHCETRAPERRKTVMVTGSVGEPIEPVVEPTTTVFGPSDTPPVATPPFTAVPLASPPLVPATPTPPPSIGPAVGAAPPAA